MNRQWHRTGHWTHENVLPFGAGLQILAGMQAGLLLSGTGLRLELLRVFANC